MPLNSLFNLVWFPRILTFFFVNHMLKFKLLAQIMSYAKIDCSLASFIVSPCILIH